MKLHRRQLPCLKAPFLASLENYRAAMVAHAKTEGVPAPFPDFEIMRAVYESGAPLEIVQEVIVSASYLTASPDAVSLQIAGESGPRTVSLATDPYMQDLLHDWQTGGGVVSAYQPPSPRVACADQDQYLGARATGAEIQPRGGDGHGYRENGVSMTKEV
jgi:hypothetical protein